MMNNFLKVALMAIAFMAATSVMAQTTDATTGATVVNTDSAMIHKGGHHGKMHQRRQSPHNKAFVPDSTMMRRQRGHGDKNWRKEQHWQRPVVGSVSDTLPRGAMSFVRDGQQKFHVYGVVYESFVDNGTIKYKVTEVREAHHHRGRK